MKPYFRFLSIIFLFSTINMAFVFEKKINTPLWKITTNSELQTSLQKEKKPTFLQRHLTKMLSKQVPDTNNVKIKIAPAKGDKLASGGMWSVIIGIVTSFISYFLPFTGLLGLLLYMILILSAIAILVGMVISLVVLVDKEIALSPKGKRKAKVGLLIALLLLLLISLYFYLAIKGA